MPPHEGLGDVPSLVSFILVHFATGSLPMEVTSCVSHPNALCNGKFPNAHCNKNLLSLFGHGFLATPWLQAMASSIATWSLRME